MKMLVALAVFFLVSTQLFAEEIGANDDLNYWSDWSDSDQIKEELPEPFEHLLQRIARRPKPQQFFGLMGKRDAGEMGSHPSLALRGTALSQRTCLLFFECLLLP
ncbi:Protachykinin-1 [Galemys pyrenaicus]|uniref:Protachykinin-1 n=1 Tax=Galemys pyrenaicus TaxID=202257 RepID=A0A8J6AKB1_GALPY|nr:Protachykinin-1 [Galemys pyrenaicus]